MTSAQKIIDQELAQFGWVGSIATNSISDFKSAKESVVELRTDEKLESGDVLLMSILDSTLNHVAIFLGDEVLHHLTDRLSCREPYSPWLLKCTGKRYRYAS